MRFKTTDIVLQEFVLRIAVSCDHNNQGVSKVYGFKVAGRQKERRKESERGGGWGHKL